MLFVNASLLIADRRDKPATMTKRNIVIITGVESPASAQKIGKKNTMINAFVDTEDCFSPGGSEILFEKTERNPTAAIVISSRMPVSVNSINRTLIKNESFPLIHFSSKPVARPIHIIDWKYLNRSLLI